MTALPPADDPAPAPIPDVYATLVDGLRQLPGLPERLLAVHQPDRDGRCRARPLDDGADRHQWPCLFHEAAAEVVAST